nr:NADH dehydrogenase subunit 1 [Kinnaridae sp.]
MVFFKIFFLFIFIFLGVAFFTLFERKVLGFIQFRLGPVSVGYIGLFQPFSDALKLFSKEFSFMVFGNYFIYLFVPIFSLMISMIVWLLYPFFFNLISFNLGGLFFFCCSGFGVYFVMLAGWSSNSMYSSLGAMRSVAQSISYEVCLFILMIFFFILIGSFNFMSFYFFQDGIYFFFFFPYMFFVFFSCMLAETNRSPFDLVEGESELVSGFNLEYSSFSFSLFFLSEYSMIMFISFLICLMFFGSDFFSLFFFFSVIFFCFLFIWIRSTLPRYRYDYLMSLSWKCYLPFVLNLMIFMIFFKLYFYFMKFSKF